MVEYITEKGKEMLAKMLAGSITITFTRIQMGDGVRPEEQSEKNMTELVNQIEELEVYQTKINSDNTVSIMGIFDNSTLESGFYFREKGVFATDGEGEILFTYANAGSTAEYINPPTVELVEKQIISIYKNLQGTDENVNITTKSGIYALQEDLKEHTADEVKHITDEERMKFRKKADAKDPVFTGTLSKNRKADTEIGAYSTALGNESTASGEYSVALGPHAKAIGDAAISIGYGAIARGNHSFAMSVESQSNGNYSFATGFNAKADGNYSCAMGEYTMSSGTNSHAGGKNTVAKGNVSYAGGYHTTALDFQYAIGHYNNTTLATPSIYAGTSGGTAFVIGNGTSATPSNAMRITDDGAVIGKKAYQASGADYAERKEWADGNPDAEDRRGYFVTMDGDKIKIASPGDFLLGVISANPCIIGNDDEGWVGEFEKDEFGDFIMEETESEDEETGKITKSIFYKVNPEYDPAQEYIHRKDRKEWDCVGMLGFLATRDDGTCQVNEYCTVTDGGIATASQQGYRVVERVNDSLIKILFR